MARSKPLTPLEHQALVVAGRTAKLTRDLVKAGRGQKVDFLVRVHGQVNVGPDDPDAKTNVKPQLEPALAIVLAHLGAGTRQKVFEALVEYYPRYEAEALDPQAVDLAKTAIALLTAREAEPRRGSVTGEVTVERQPRGSRKG